ncbi:rCG52027 [Rattus norvegicus]|uniref:RCG52027 n=1 Tax=Rattus norvegicus TaxID=10116 RepID=A6K2X8_RAT|nr:rCG52027 [Rattus norvegicus]
MDEVPALGEDSTLAVRRGRRGHRWGAPTAPAASQLSAPELTRLDTGLLSRRPAWVAATSGLTLNTRGVRAGLGARTSRAQPRRSPTAFRVFKIPK